MRRSERYLTWRSKSVSYTHLDVYKRQVMKVYNIEFCSHSHFNSFPSIIPNNFLHINMTSFELFKLLVKPIHINLETKKLTINNRRTTVVIERFLARKSLTRLNFLIVVKNLKNPQTIATRTEKICVHKIIIMYMIWYITLYQ